MPKSVGSAFKWSAIEQAGQQASGFVLSIILARLLSPSEFGLTGMLSVFFAVSQAFIDAGFGSALIQRNDLTEEDTTSCFYLNVASSVVLAGFLCLFSPWVAEFYGVPVLAPMLCLLSLRLVFGGLGIVQNSLRARDLDFKTLAIANWSATTGAGVVGILMAWRGFGVWSLVAQAILRTFTATLALWLLRPWRPRGSFRWSSIRKLWSFSSRLLAASVLNSMFQNSSAVIIGKLYSASDLGLYTRAQSFSDTLSRTLSSVVGRVAFPYFSSLQTEPAKMRMRLRQFLRLTAMFHFPAMIGLAAAAPALVNALLTEKWAECVPLLRILSFSGFLYPLHAYHLQALVALGRSDLFFRLEVVKKLLIVMNLLITSHISVFAMACGLVITSSFSYWINSFYTRRLLAYSWSEQLGDLLPPLIASLIVGAVGLGAGLMHTSSSWITLGLQIMAMLLVFGATVITAMKSKVPELVVVVASVLGRNR